MNENHFKFGDFNQYYQEELSAFSNITSLEPGKASSQPANNSNESSSSITDDEPSTSNEPINQETQYSEPVKCNVGSFNTPLKRMVFNGQAVGFGITVAAAQNFSYTDNPATGNKQDKIADVAISSDQLSKGLSSQNEVEVPAIQQYKKNEEIIMGKEALNERDTNSTPAMVEGGANLSSDSGVSAPSDDNGKGVVDSLMISVSSTEELEKQPASDTVVPPESTSSNAFTKVSLANGKDSVWQDSVWRDSVFKVSSSSATSTDIKSGASQSSSSMDNAVMSSPEEDNNGDLIFGDDKAAPSQASTGTLSTTTSVGQSSLFDEASKKPSEQPHPSVTLSDPEVTTAAPQHSPDTSSKSAGSLEDAANLGAGASGSTALIHSDVIAPQQPKPSKSVDDLAAAAISLQKGKTSADETAESSDPSLSSMSNSSVTIHTTPRTKIDVQEKTIDSADNPIEADNSQKVESPAADMIPVAPTPMATPRAAAAASTAGASSSTHSSEPQLNQLNETKDQATSSLPKDTLTSAADGTQTGSPSFVLSGSDVTGNKTDTASNKDKEGKRSMATPCTAANQEMLARIKAANCDDNSRQVYLNHDNTSHTRVHNSTPQASASFYQSFKKLFSGIRERVSSTIGAIFNYFKPKNNNGKEGRRSVSTTVVDDNARRNATTTSSSAATSPSPQAAAKPTSIFGRMFSGVRGMFSRLFNRSRGNDAPIVVETSAQPAAPLSLPRLADAGPGAQPSASSSSLSTAASISASNSASGFVLYSLHNKNKSKPDGCFHATTPTSGSVSKNEASPLVIPSSRCGNLNPQM